jgi:putative ABC transport system permease protein
MDLLTLDVRYAFRGLRRQPGFTLLAVLTLALGIGGATTMFSVIQNVLFNPFPYVDASKVVMPQIVDARAGGNSGRAWFKPREFLELQAQSQVFSAAIGSAPDSIVYTTAEGTECLTGTLCTGNMFQFLGVPALIGRTLTPDDAKPGAAPVFVIRFAFWKSRFNADPAVLGQTFVLNGVPRTLVGVMPPRFTKGDGELYLACAVDPADPALTDKPFRFQAKLQPGVSLTQAQAALDVFFHHRAQVHPEDYPAVFTVRVVSWVDNIVKGFRQTLYTLAAAVALLLFIACANVANLLLARATTRQKEIALRAALGAGRGRIVRQLLIESFLLALMGMLVGVGFAHFGITVLARLIPMRAIPDEAEIVLNTPALLFSLVATTLTAFAFGIVPALQAAKVNLVDSLKEANAGGGSLRRGLFRRILIVTEVALSLVLLSGAGLLMRSFANIQAQEIGFSANHLLYTPLTLPRGVYDTPAARQKFFRTLLPRIAVLPGVTSMTTATSALPLRSLDSPLEIRGQSTAEKPRARYDLCSEDYLQTLGISLVEGRFLSAAEIDRARAVAVVNQAFVRRYVGDRAAIGQQVRLARVRTPGGPDSWFEIVGVVADFKNDGVLTGTAPEMFLPYTVDAAGDRALLIRTAGEPLAMLNLVRHEIWSVDRAVALTESDSLSEILVRYAFAGPRFTLLVLGVFATVGLVLVGLGIYSVIAFVVARQTRDFGIRMAGRAAARRPSAGAGSGLRRHRHRNRGWRRYQPGGGTRARQ